MSEVFNVILGGLDTEVDVSFAEESGIDPSVLLALRGDKGEQGNGIANIAKTSSSGLVDTYTVTYTNGATDTIAITNGANGQDGKDGKDGTGVQIVRW